MNIENIFDYIRYACYYYVPDKANMKKIKQLFHAIPFFIPKEYQNRLFKIIISHPIESYYDSRDNMNEYGYIIYKEFHNEINKRVKDYNEYSRELFIGHDDSTYKIKRSHTIFFILFIVILISLLFYINNSSS
jgi:hypothetical protein